MTKKLLVSGAVLGTVLLLASCKQSSVVSTEKNADSRSASATSRVDQNNFSVFAGGNYGMIAYSGTNHDVSGNMHSNYSVILNTNNGKIDKDCEASGYIVSNGNVVITNKIPNAPKLPTPDLSAKVTSQIAIATQSFSGDKSFTWSNVSNAYSSYNVTGKVTISSKNVTGPNFVIAKKDIDINKLVNVKQLGSVDQIVYGSTEGSINISVDNAEINGIIYAPKGSINISGRNCKITGKLIAGNSINISGDNIDVIGEEVVTHYPPVIITTPDTNLTVEQPGDTVLADFNTWSMIQFPEQGSSGHVTPNWKVNSANSNHITQDQNAHATIMMGNFAGSNFTAKGTMKPIGSDDDYIGFVFGYQDMQHFYILAWRASDEGSQRNGLSLHVVNSSTPVYEEELTKSWGTGDSRIINLDSNKTPWVLNTEYEYELTHNAPNISITIREKATGTLIANLKATDNTYPSGKFGIYNYSQAADYSALTYRGNVINDYVYNIEVTDADLIDNIAITSESPSAVPPMTFVQTGPKTAKLTWKYSYSSMKDFPVTKVPVKITARDSYGLSDVQEFNLNLRVK